MLIFAKLVVFIVCILVLTWALDEGHETTALVFAVVALLFGAEIVGIGA